MRVVLLTRGSEFQTYCANTLWRRGRLNAVVVEQGYSFERGEGLLNTLGVLWRNLSPILGTIASRPTAAIEYARLFLKKDEYLGAQERHNRRILKSDFTHFAPDLPVRAVDDINGDAARAALQQIDPDIVLVFGTRLIKADVFHSIRVPFVNMHWGWSPTYRGEGIVSALAAEGPGALGVTVHLLSTKIDGGDILHRARPAVDAEDNFYSIGLKLTLLGTDLFERVLSDYARAKTLSGEPQDLSKGRLFNSRYMKTHPGTYHQAWRNLRRAAPHGEPLKTPA